MSFSVFRIEVSYNTRYHTYHFIWDRRGQDLEIPLIHITILTILFGIEEHMTGQEGQAIKLLVIFIP